MHTIPNFLETVRIQHHHQQFLFSGCRCDYLGFAIIGREWDVIGALAYIEDRFSFVFTSDLVIQGLGQPFPIHLKQKAYVPSSSADVVELHPPSPVFCKGTGCQSLKKPATNVSAPYYVHVTSPTSSLLLKKQFYFDRQRT